MQRIEKLNNKQRKIADHFKNGFECLIYKKPLITERIFIIREKNTAFSTTRTKFKDLVFGIGRH